VALDLVITAVARQGQGMCLTGVSEGSHIRLIAPTPDGTFYPRDFRFVTPVFPRPFDRIQVEAPWLDSRAGRPENRIVAERPWRLVERAHTGLVLPVFEGPELFGDRTSAVRSSDHSLVCIGADAIRIVVLRSSRIRLRVAFRFQGHDYDLPFLDRHWSEFAWRRPPGTYTLEQIGCRGHSGVHLIVGLGEPFRGWMYKLVLGILPVLKSHKRSTWCPPQSRSRSASNSIT
jgi:hypothetical protein